MHVMYAVWWVKTFVSMFCEYLLAYRSFYPVYSLQIKSCEPSGIWRLFIPCDSSSFSLVVYNIQYLAVPCYFDMVLRMPKRQFRSTTWNMRGNHQLVNCPTGTRAQKLAARNSIKCTLAAHPGICTKPQTPLKRDFTLRQTVRGSPAVACRLKAARLFGLFEKVKGRRKANSFKETCVE